MFHLFERIYDVSMRETNFSIDPASYHQGAFLIINKQIVPLVKKVTTLGRQFENDIVFHEDFLSRFHAEIIHEENKYILYDKQSTSGTFVNSRKIDQCVLNSGDLISFANILVMFVNNDSKITGKSMGTTQTLHNKSGLMEDGRA